MRRFLRSFRWAGAGFVYCVRSERNFRVHLVLASCALMAAPFYHFSRAEYAVLFAVIGMVLGFEMLNTAVERAGDAVTRERREELRRAKDAAAGGVLAGAAAALAVGFALFWDGEVLREAAAFFAARPAALALTAVWLGLCAAFIGLPLADGKRGGGDGRKGR